MQTQTFQSLDRCRPIGRGQGVGYRQAAEALGGENLSASAHQFWLGTPQHQSPDRINKLTAGDTKAALDQESAMLVIGCEQNLKRSPLANLGIELAGGAKAWLEPVPGGLLKARRQLLKCGGKVGGNCQPQLVSSDRQSQDDEQEQQRPDDLW